MCRTSLYVAPQAVTVAIASMLLAAPARCSPTSTAKRTSSTPAGGSSSALDAGDRAQQATGSSDSAVHAAQRAFAAHAPERSKAAPKGGLACLDAVLAAVTSSHGSSNDRLVEILRRYAKLPAPTAVPVDPRTSQQTPGRVHSVAKRLGPEAVGQLVDGYVSGGLSCSALAVKFDISKTAVVRLLHEQEVQMRARNISWPR